MKNNNCKVSLFHLFSLILVFTSSCTQHKEQYQPSQSSHSNTSLENNSQELSLASQQADTNMAVNNIIVSKANTTVDSQAVYKKIIQNTSFPIDYETSSIASIDINNSLKEVTSILNPINWINDEEQLGVKYREDLFIIFEKDKNTEISAEESYKIQSISVEKSYKGVLDFGYKIGKKRIGDSFSNHFNLNEPNIQKDLKAQDFIRSLFNHFEKTNVDCFESNQCFSYFSDSLFSVELPKMILNFGTDERRALIKVVLKEEDQTKSFASMVNYQNRSIDDEDSITDLIFTVPNKTLLDFGPQVGLRKSQDSFSDIMNLTSFKPEKNKETQSFIISLYNYLEETDINCLEEKKCDIENLEDTNLLAFKLPKIWLTFNKNNLATLNSMILIGEVFEKSLQNLKAPFTYEEGFISNININMTKEEIEKILPAKFKLEVENLSLYILERILIEWNEDGSVSKINMLSEKEMEELTNQENINTIINIINHEKSFNFTSEIRDRKLGSSFADVFNLDQVNLKQDLNAKNFIVSLYNFWEKSNENCLETNKCEITFDEEYIQFSLPKTALIFSNDFERIFLNIALKGSEIQRKEANFLKNIVEPINPFDMSIGNININMTKEEIEKILNIYNTDNNTSIYKEGLVIIWNKNYPSVITAKEISPGNHSVKTYKGYFDFGSEVGLKRIGDSFSDQFTDSIKNSTQDPKAKDFIVSIYQLLSKDTESNCLEINLCSIINPQHDIIVFQLPFIDLVFENNNQKTMKALTFTRGNNFNELVI